MSRFLKHPSLKHPASKYKPSEAVPPRNVTSNAYSVPLLEGEAFFGFTPEAESFGDSGRL
jgi:hypothetical protein